MKGRWILTALVAFCVAAWFLQRLDLGAEDNRQIQQAMISIHKELSSLNERKASKATINDFTRRSLEKLDLITAELARDSIAYPLNRRMQFEWENQTARERLSLQAAVTALKRILKASQPVGKQQNDEYMHLMAGVDRIRNEGYAVVPTDPKRAERLRTLDYPVHPMTWVLGGVTTAMLLWLAYAWVRARRRAAPKQPASPEAPVNIEPGQPVAAPITPPSCPGKT